MQVSSQQANPQPASQAQDGGAAAAGSPAAGWLAVLRCDPGSGEALWSLRRACEGRLEQESGARAAAAEGECSHRRQHRQWRRRPLSLTLTAQLGRGALLHG